MKKLLLLMLVFVSTASSFAQNQQGIVRLDSQSDPTRSGEYVCAPNSVFSSVAPSISFGLLCQSGYLFEQVADDYSASGPFASIRFWGGDLTGCTLDPTESFDIIIYDGNPSTTGQVVHSFTLDGDVTVMPTLYAGTYIYQIDVDFGETISQTDGWIGITRNAPSCDVGFMWIGGANGNSVNKNNVGAWGTTPFEVMFCLGAGDPSVPVSNWAIILGVLMMVTFVAIRFRRIIA